MQRTVHIKKKKEFDDTSSLNQFAERWAPNFYIQRREGQVLSRGMLLKYDIFQSSKIVRSRNDVSISGGPNYRKIDELLPLCAVGQPSIHGIRTILNLLIGSPEKTSNVEQSNLLKQFNDLEDAAIMLLPEKSISSHTSNTDQTGRCIWLNLREEPMVYLNNRPFVLRDADHPFRNIQTFAGITWQHLREVEQRLKRDILIEASHPRNILIHKENHSKQLMPFWEGITYATVQTSEQAFSGLISEGYDVQYYRVPLTPESDLLHSTIDSIFKIVIKHSLKYESMPYFIMNCQMGRGRSTLVTILVWLIFNKLGLVSDSNSDSNRESVITDSDTFEFSPPAQRKLFRVPAIAAIPITAMGMKKSQSNPSFTQLSRRNNKLTHVHKEQSEHGDYEIIHRILRLLSHGIKSKQNVDAAIESCGDLYHLKNEMAWCRLRLENAENDDEKELATSESQVILSKYCTLITFAAYLQSIKLEDLCNVNKRFDFTKYSFSSWMNSFPSLQRTISGIISLSYDDLMEKYKTKMPSSSLNTMLIFNRVGSVLSPNTILKADIPKKLQKSFRNLKLNEHLSSIKFRLLQDVGIATVSQPPSAVIRSILKNKLKQEEKKENNKVIWIDLREEPILYIRGNPYVVRNYNRPFQRLPEFDNLLTAQQINDIAERVKVDIKQEALENDNKMLVHYETEYHELKESTLPIDMTNENEIQTTQQIFEALRHEGYNITYQKLPFNPKNSLDPTQVERLGNAIYTHIETDSIIIFNCRQGIHRSTVAAILAILIAYHVGTLTYVHEDDELEHAFKSNRFHQLYSKSVTATPIKHISPKMPLVTPPTIDLTAAELKCDSDDGDDRDDGGSLRSSPPLDENEDDDTENDTECRAVLALIRILRKGLAMKRQIDNAIESFSEYYHVKNAIYESRAKWENARTKEESQAYLQKAMRHLRIYTNLICYNAYLNEYYYAKEYNDTVAHKYKLLSFTEWMQSRLELSLWLNKMNSNPQLALSMNSMDLDDEQEEKGYSQVFHQRGRRSSVLSGNAMLKVDYFPGCAKLQSNPEAENAINFRYIDSVGVAGVAIPTTRAMQEIILFCAQKWKQKNKSSAAAPIHWICLREEPVLYVNDEPVVLRELHQPYENLIFTGITIKRVEAMEKALKQDAGTECAKFENKLLIHSESDTGNLFAEWEQVQNNKIMTCNEAYTEAFTIAITNSDLNIKPTYHRLPITDEQAPPAMIIDTFIGLFEQNANDSIFIFNCQMGRGRTTTGMVIYALWKRKLKLYNYKRSVSGHGGYGVNEAKVQSKSEALINGEYYAVLDLLRILPQGKKAKKWCDDVLDVLSHMQNLRKAIYKMKVSGEKAVSDKSKKHLAHRTQNYLQRYCLLIALTSYLLNDYKLPINNDEQDKRVNFEEWLHERAAVKNCIYSASLEKD